MPRANKYRRGILAGSWLVITLSLAGWWMVFGLRQIHLLERVEESKQLVRYQHMLLWEGSFLLLVVLAGGIALLYFSYLDLRRHEQLKAFFSSFTHDVKTSLASLRLQAEVIEEEKPSPNLARLLRDVVRLELQLDNSLFLANANSGRIFLEQIELRRIVERLSHYWPELDLKLSNNARVRADQRALESVLKNLIQNARIHGEASAVTITASKVENGRIGISVQDNGKGFKGSLDSLGAAYLSPQGKNGSGLGIYLSRELLGRMNGSLQFSKGEQTGLKAILSIPGELI